MSITILKSISSKYCTCFGRLAVAMGYVDQAQLAAALRRQSTVTNQEHRFLATILFDSAWMTGQQVDEVLNALSKELQQNDAEDLGARYFAVSDQF